MTKIKICGITMDNEIDYINEVMVDYVGFVFANSKRKVTYECAKRLRSRLSRNIKTVGVFVNEDIDNIARLVKNNIIDVIQLHGNEDISYIKKLRKVICLEQSVKQKQEGDNFIEIIKVFKIKEQFDADVLKNYINVSDYFLFDTYQKDCEGGSGKSFKIEYINKSKINMPYFIAGGLNIDNIDKVLETKPFAVDISSGVETNGVKDKNKIIKLVKKIQIKNHR